MGLELFLRILPIADATSFHLARSMHINIIYYRTALEAANPRKVECDAWVYDQEEFKSTLVNEVSYFLFQYSLHIIFVI